MGYPRAYGMKRLFDYLNSGFVIECYGGDIDATRHAVVPPNNGVMDNGNYYVNIMPFLAYQKIYNDFYRNSQWEKPTPSSFNVDYYHKIGDLDHIEEALIREEDGVKFFGRTPFDIAYADFPKDYFTGVLPNKQYGDPALASPLISTKGRFRLHHLSNHYL